MNDWHFMARYSYFDDWYDSEDTLSYDGYGVVDAAAGVGNQYSQWAPGGFNGQFVYMRLIYDF
jgi:iron complex outermembrane receptor protein